MSAAELQNPQTPSCLHSRPSNTDANSCFISHLTSSQPSWQSRVENSAEAKRSSEADQDSLGAAEGNYQAFSVMWASTNGIQANDIPGTALTIGLPQSGGGGSESIQESTAAPAAACGFTLLCSPPRAPDLAQGAGQGNSGAACCNATRHRCVALTLVGGPIPTRNVVSGHPVRSTLANGRSHSHDASSLVNQ